MAVVANYLNIGLNRVKAIISAYFRKQANPNDNADIFDYRLEPLF